MIQKKFKTKLYCYTIFHLNILYSSIPQSEWPVLVKSCYWPLLDMCRRLSIPLGITAPAYTLEEIARIDPSWAPALKELWAKGKCEFIASGYSQLIGPLVPARVNEQNLLIGNDVYKKFLGKTPAIGYINEQAYAQGLIEHYRNAGFNGIVMEWNNPWRFHPEWDREWRYYPQLARDQKGKKIPLLWNDSIAFQKFQRYAQGEMDLPEYMNYLKEQEGSSPRFFSLYGNDAEVFDYRPGRYATEANIHPEGEWKRIETLFTRVAQEEQYTFIGPSEILKLAKGKNAYHSIHLESPDQPIPVKKQEKYNASRWGLTGRDDLGINTACYRIYKSLTRKSLRKEWKKICFLWSSDFRTHIEEKKFLAFRKRLDAMLSLTQSHKNFSLMHPVVTHQKPSSPRISYEGDLLLIETAKLKLALNLKRGLAIHSALFKEVSLQPLLGTLPHGYYQDIAFGADFYTGHTVIEMFGKPKITDLSAVKPTITHHKDRLDMSSLFHTPLGSMVKTLTVYLAEERFDIASSFDFQGLGPCSFASGIITIQPEGFNASSLFYTSSNGGNSKDVFYLKHIDRIDVQPVSFLVSSPYALGNTEGLIEVGDNEKRISIETDMAQLAALPKIHFVRMDKTFFLRVLFSLGEVDDTNAMQKPRDVRWDFRVSISAIGTA